MAGFELTPEEIKLFFEEAVEQIQLMEESLIALEEEPDSPRVDSEYFSGRSHPERGGGHCWFRQRRSFDARHGVSARFGAPRRGGNVNGIGGSSTARRRRAAGQLGCHRSKRNRRRRGRFPRRSTRSPS